MKTFFLTSVIVALSILQSSCSHKPIDLKNETLVRWDSKALLVNKSNKKEQNLNITLLGVRNERLRIEITATMGYQVGSIVADRNTFKALIVPQKIFYTGRNTPEALEKLIQIPLAPLQVLRIAFDERPSEQGWICQSDVNGLINRCDNYDLSLKVEWKDRTESRKLVVITTPQFEMRWLLNSPESLTEVKPELFSLSSPEGFKNVQIN